VKIALDHIALDIALGQGSGTMLAGIVGDIELALDVKHRKRQRARLDPQGGALGNIVGAAKFDG
jgi:hypothetical protein